MSLDGKTGSHTICVVGQWTAILNQLSNKEKRGGTSTSSYPIEENIPLLT